VVDDGLTVDPSVDQSRSILNPLTLLLIASFAVLLGLLGYWLGQRQASGPGEGSADIGFARDMITHHAQAVDMATMLRDRTDDPEIRQLALDIMLTQQAQIGQMQGWLAAWNHPAASTDPAMAWMDMPVVGPMPGMAVPEELNRLRSMEGLDAEALFLQLMIPHHLGGVMMAEAALDRAEQPIVQALAQSIVDAQTSEIALMQAMLEKRGFPRVSEELDRLHNSGAHEGDGEFHETEAHP
jgi:uncharacterized protein (DUF305 family)